MAISEYPMIKQSHQSLLDSLNSNKESGLSLQIAAQRLKDEGPNELSREKPVNPWALLIDQFRSSVVILLIVATIISAVMKEYLQTLGIVTALAINGLVGFITEFRAKVSLSALSKMTGAIVRVRRAGDEMELPVQELVRGDIVLLDAGVRVPADLCVLECASFSVDESALTGESVPVWKSANPSESDKPDSTVAFQGTAVLSGRAVCVVIETGSHTRIGKLGRLLQEMVSGETPLTRSLNVLGQQLTVLVILLSTAFGLLGMLRQVSFEKMLETSIALAVAAIPEGLPVIATLALAAGISRMIKARTLVRRLPAVETLGCTTVICTDKTGTLTENKMLVTDIVFFEEKLKLSGHGYEPTGQLTADGTMRKPEGDGLDEFLSAICLCNDARLENHGGSEHWHIHGDPTEGCLITAAVKLGKDHDSLQREFPRLAELPFDLSRKRMSTIHIKQYGGCVVFCKGSPEAILPLCNQVRSKDRLLDFSPDKRDWFVTQNTELAQRGLRVLAVAMRDIERVPDDLDPDQLEKDLTLIGLVAMSDRPKDNVKEAIKTCQSAGIRIVMLTGDQPDTARAVAGELGIISPERDKTMVLTGEEIAKLRADELEVTLDRASVLACVTPEMKLNIVKCLQEKGHIVGMTGDGINDAPALRQANIGIAMGLSGTDMAREASDLVITDDNFSTIVKAVEQGRITYANICRAIGYLLTASLASVIAISLGLVVNAGLFLQPLQLLYLNLIMHVLPGLGIVLQKNPADLMNRPPRAATEKLLNNYEQAQIFARSILVAFISLLAVFVDQLYFGADSSTTVAFSTLSLSLILQSWSWLTVGTNGIYTRPILNRPMLVCSALNLIIWAMAIYFQPFQLVLNTTALNLNHVLIVLISATLTYLLSLPLRRLGQNQEHALQACRT